MITLTNGLAQATVSETGAWLESLTVNGRPLLFPKATLSSDSGETRTRGGMHVCLPNFGPDLSGTLRQHGFGRESVWKVTERSASSVQLFLSGGSAVYDKLESQLTYGLTPTSITARLTLHNQGSTALRVAPGFHPYFWLDESETAVAVNDQMYELASLPDTTFVTCDNVELRTSLGHLTMHQENLPTWALWTDGLANYVCVEPTYGGYRFLEIPTPNEHLTPGAEKTFSITINW